MVARGSGEEGQWPGGKTARLLIELVAEVEARADPAEIAWLLAYIG